MYLTDLWALLRLAKVTIEKPWFPETTEALGANVTKGVCRDDPCEGLNSPCEVLDLPFWTSHGALGGGKTTNSSSGMIP